MKLCPPLSSCRLVEGEKSDFRPFYPEWEPLVLRAVSVAKRKLAALHSKPRKNSGPASLESVSMASIDWKGAKWEAYYSSLSIPELLTVLKGYGPLEPLCFEVCGRFKGQLSLCLAPDGRKEITLYQLEVCGKKREGRGREALRWIRQTFKGEIFLEFPDLPDPRIGFHPTIPFWFQMYREGLVDTLDCENFYLTPQATSEQINEFQEHIKAVLGRGERT